MRPRDDNNFLIEVTPEVMDEIHRLLPEEQDNTIELRYSPYWNWDEHLKRRKKAREAAGEETS